MNNLQVSSHDDVEAVKLRNKLLKLGSVLLSLLRVVDRARADDDKHALIASLDNLGSGLAGTVGREGELSTWTEGRSTHEQIVLLPTSVERIWCFNRAGWMRGSY